MQHIAHIYTDFPEKFGIPRQSGLVPEALATVVFTPEYRDPAALRGLEGFSHIWLLWEFSESVGHPWSPTVRPPRLGGNERLGVFATRAPFRPNPIGLSCVRLERIVPDGPAGPTLVVSGVDMLSGTPIYDVKPYLPYTDCIPDAVGGFASTPPAPAMEVEIPTPLLERLPPEKRPVLLAALAQDPRPRYQSDPSRVYGMAFADQQVRFCVDENRLTVVDIC